MFFIRNQMYMNAMKRHDDSSCMSFKFCLADSRNIEKSYFTKPCNDNMEAPVIFEIFRSVHAWWYAIWQEYVANMYYATVM
jgi:hypothetical protein